MSVDHGSATAASHWFSRLRRGLRPGAAAIGAGCFALAVGTSAAGAATTPGQTSFTFSGTVNGTLSTPDSACSDQVVTAKGATFMLTGALKGAPATKWTIQLYNPKAGTSKKFGQLSGNGPSVTLIGADSNGNENWNWTSVTKNGSITTAKTSGKVSTTLGPYSSFRGKAGKGKVHVTGSWACTS
jgi:predicted extracellular nuclease